MFRGAVSLFLVGLLAFTASAVAETRYVATNGVHASPFTNWVDAATNIQAAIDVSSDGDQIMIGAGTYQGSGDLDMDFGGRAITLCSVDGPTNTVIDCGNAGPGFCFHSGETTQSVLCGLTILNASGGVVCVSNSSPQIENCLFLNNGLTVAMTVTSYDTHGNETFLQESYCSSGTGGGAVYCEASSPQILGCTFVNNFSGGGSGGALCIVSNSAPTIDGCTILGNCSGSSYSTLFTRVSSYDGNGRLVFQSESRESHLDGFGGGIYCDSSDLTIRHSTIVSNTAGFDGGGIYARGGSVQLIDSTTTCNRAGVTDGGTNTTITTIQYDSGGRERFRQIDTLTDSGRSGAGGGVYGNGSSLMVEDDAMTGNNAPSGGGAICVVSNSSLVVTNCILDGNSAGVPASSGTVVAVSYYDSGGRLAYRSTSGQSSQDAFGDGGGILADSSSLSVYGSTIVSNTAAVSGGGVYAGTGPVTMIQDSDLGYNQCAVSWSNDVEVIQYDSSGQEVYRSHNDSTQFCGIGSGAGLYCATLGASIQTSRVHDNVSIGDGGGLMLAGSGSEVDHCTVSGNSAGHYGGGILCDASNVVISDCTITTNVAADGGGGMCCLSNSTAQITRCRVEQNCQEHAGEGTTITIRGYDEHGYMVFESVAYTPAADGGYGGGLLCEASSPVVDQCLFASNRANQFGGGIACVGQASPTVDRSVILFNLVGVGRTTVVVWPSGGGDSVYSNDYLFVTNGYGSAICDDSSSLLLRNCTIVSNRLGDFSNSVFAVGAATVSVWNTILWGESACTSSGAEVDLSYCCYADGDPAAGNIADDPQLTRQWRLKSSSPCIDAGTMTNSTSLDFDGESRWDDPRHSNRVSIVDIGADEFVDTDLDGIADAWEIQVFGNLSVMGADTDFDQDGLTDRGEYEWGTDPTNRDTDGDTMADGWEVAYGLDPLFNDGGLDPDGDLYDNAAEFIADTNPTNAADYPQFDSVADSDGQPVVSWNGRTSRVYQISFSTDFMTWTSVYESAGGGPGQSYTNTAGDLSGAYRLHVPLP